MQKFGLQRTQSSIHSGIEAEIVKEQASALGRAGRKLRLALEEYERDNHSLPKGKLDPLINKISSSVWELILQREFVGFVDGNLEWIEKNYAIPQQALNSLGKVSK